MCVKFARKEKKMAILGIDLGTTNSLGAVYRNNKVELIPNRFGSFLTPSVVSIDEGKILVGQIAKERLVSHPDLSAVSFKKDMGTKQKYKLGDKEFLPEELSSFVIRSIVDDAKAYLKEEIDEVIVSVPAYFHDKQRVATKKAGVLAGVPVKRIINEPSAAAMASYFENGKEQLFLVFDFGGGTLDVSIVECFDTMVEIISVAGDNRLGGDNFHEVMSTNFMKEHGLDVQKITDKERAILLRKAEECKRALTTEDFANMTAIVGGQSYTSTYTNQRLLDESGLLLAKIKDVLAHALRDGGISINEIDAVVMVGGSSKMPLIQSYLQHLMKTTPFVTENCDEMIVRGLGLVCAVKARNEDVKDYILTDICPFTLGTGVYNEAAPDNSYMCAIIPRNTVLPCSIVKRLFTVRDNQTRVNIDIAQGEHAYVKDNIILDEINVMVPRNKKAEDVYWNRDTIIEGRFIGEHISDLKAAYGIIQKHINEEGGTDWGGEYGAYICDDKFRVRYKAEVGEFIFWPRFTNVRVVGFSGMKQLANEISNLPNRVEVIREQLGWKSHKGFMGKLLKAY